MLVATEYKAMKRQAPEERHVETLKWIMKSDSKSLTGQIGIYLEFLRFASACNQEFTLMLFSSASCNNKLCYLACAKPTNYNPAQIGGE